MYLQWLGESDLRFKMQGRLILVHLMCRDMAAPQSLEKIIGIDNDITGKLTHCIFFWLHIYLVFGCLFDSMKDNCSIAFSILWTINYCRVGNWNIKFTTTLVRSCVINNYVLVYSIGQMLVRVTKKKKQNYML